ncbi:uncharacterized protein LOC120254107 [Dioscorea cayenensis subsp. rotundata]|uniref:Uncharacterized protein LOC120254107 n=1 Tax=Dioscorea cayennensis subsp. rotundata TaxID=55577 RepID=A0AB40ASZ1_DIOCR|nr:uncharacterized protein LOC120254107 [Dioscorea cayenensis subsp. rotundata]
MFPIAWAVVQVATSETWSWFVDLLKSDLGLVDGLGWALVSDMQKGLIYAVKDLLPMIKHRMCARHIYARWRKNTMARSFKLNFGAFIGVLTSPRCTNSWIQMTTLKGGETAVEELLKKWPISGWCQAFFNDFVKCEVINNNMCETFNGVILESRSKSIISMLEDIRQYVMTRIAIKREYTKKWRCDCGPSIIPKIEKERQKSAKWQVEWNGGASHEVYWDNLILNEREGYVVLLADEMCSCGKWQKSSIPCQHSLATIAFVGADPLNYVSDWLKKDRYLKAYSFVLNPVRGRSFWPISVEGSLLPPMARRMPGRPVKKRKRKPLESKSKSKTKLSREGRAFKYSICHVEGHNKLSCPKRASFFIDSNDSNHEPTKPTNVSLGGEGACTDGIVIGREAPKSTAFISPSELIRMGNRGATHGQQQKQNEQSQSAEFTTSKLSTQQSITAVATKEKF